MNKQLTAVAAALAVLASPAFGASALELYGKVNISVQNSDVQKDGGDKWELKSNASRLGVKGELAIDDGFTGIYQFEWEVDAADNSGGDLNFKSRNQWVGLKGGAGQVIMGRSDTPTKLAQNKIDLFNDLQGDIKAIFNGEIRASNIIHYTTPSFGGFKANVASLLQEKVDTAAVKTDDGQDGLFDATSISLEWSNKSLFLALALDNNIGYSTVTKKEGYLDGAETLRAVAQYSVGDFQFGAMYQEHDNGSTIDADGLLFSVAYKVGENTTLKVQHGESDILAKGGEQTQFGVDYKLSKNIMVFGFYTSETATGTNTDKDYLGAGLEVKF